MQNLIKPKVLNDNVADDLKQKIEEMCEDMKKGNFEFHFVDEDAELDEYFSFMIALRKAARSVNAEFEKMRIGHRSLHDPLCTPSYDRTVVYALVDKHLPHDTAEIVKEKFERRYATKVWGAILPITALDQILFREHDQDLV